MHESCSAKQSRRLTISDLPLPSSFHARVARVRRSTQQRQAAQSLQKQLQLRNYLCEYNISLGGSITASNTSAPSSSKQQSPHHNGSSHSTPTVPIEYVSHVDKHFENKPYSFRKPVESSASTEDSHHRDKVANIAHTMYTPSGAAVTHVDPATASWMSNLREASSGRTPKRSNLNTTNSNVAMSNDADSERGWFTPATPALGLGLDYNSDSSSQNYSSTRSSAAAISYFSKSKQGRGPQPQQQQLQATIHSAKQVTESRAPRLLVDELLDRRKTIREERQRMEQEAEANRIKVIIET